MKQFLKDNWFKIIILLVILLIPNSDVGASNYKTFIVEEVVSYDKLLITDGYSEYIVDLGFGCSTYSLYSGSAILIDTYFSPGFYDDVIIKTTFGTDTCSISDSEEVNLKKYFVESVIDSKDEIIVKDNVGNRYLVEYGIGCLSMWRYEGKYIDIDIGGAFLDGISDQIYLFDSDDDCKVWDADELSGSSAGGYTPPSNPVKTCPINSSLTATGCVCNSGYVTDSTKTYCVAQTPSCPANSSYVNGACACNEGYTVASTGGCITYTLNCAAKYGYAHGDKNSCYCDTGYEMDTTKNLCVPVLTCPANSTKNNGQCFCNDGYLWSGTACITHTQDCINSFGYNIHGSKGDDSNSSCNCDDGYQWNSSKTACVKSENTPTVQEESKQLQQAENNAVGQELGRSYPEIKEEKEPFISWSKIFSPIKNFWKWIFKK